MSEYDLALYFWSTIIGLGVLGPLTYALASAVCDALDAHEAAPPASLTSAPIPSRP